MAATQLGAFARSVGGTAAITGVLSAAGFAAATSRDAAIGVPIRHDAAAFTLLGTSWIFDTLSLLLRQIVSPWSSAPLVAPVILTIVALLLLPLTAWGRYRLPSWSRDPIFGVTLLVLAAGGLSASGLYVYDAAMQVRDLTHEAISDVSEPRIRRTLEALQSANDGALWSLYGEPVVLATWTALLGVVGWYRCRPSAKDDGVSRGDEERRLPPMILKWVPIAIGALAALQGLRLPSVYGLYILAGVQPQCIEVILAGKTRSERLGFEVSAGALGDSRLHVIETRAGYAPLARSWPWDEVHGRGLRPRECGESMYRRVPPTEADEAGSEGDEDT